jgi:hypothetical protein
VPYSEGSNVESVTIQAMKTAGVPFEFQGGAILSVGGVGQTQFTNSDKTVEYWGWCYQVDGSRDFAVAAKDFSLRGDHHEVVWYYGAINQSATGEFDSHCIPSRKAGRILKRF